jgi:glycogen(starch) synthase
MRILALTNLYPPHYLGGYELICSRVLRALRRRGHQVMVLTSDHTVDCAADSRNGTGNVPDEPSVERRLKIHGFYGHPWLGIPKLRFLEQHNNETLRAAIRRHKPDLVYVWNMGGLSKSLLFTLQAIGLPVVFYMSDPWIARGLESDVWLSWWNRNDAPLCRRLVRSVLTSAGVRRHWQSRAPTNPLKHLAFQRIYFCSRALRSLTAVAGFDVNHGAIIYCPVDIGQFNGTPRSMAGPMKRLLYVGRLAPDKGVMTALRALVALRGRFEGQLSIFGHGEAIYVSELKRFASQNNLPVAFAQATEAEMPAIYRSHDALLFTSEWVEPFALTPLEAMASGLPVIGTTTGGSAELFRHGENALTYAAGNAEELAGCILQLSGNPSLREQCANTAYGEVRQRYAEPIIVDQIEEYLQESLVQWRPVGLPNYNS